MADELWGSETAKAVENFPVSGHPIPAPVIRALGRLKAAAARANADLGKLDSDLAERIAAAGDAIAAGEHDEQFPVDVFQTGSGTSSNMNANEVIANLAGEGVHRNDHVNMGQSSNDVFPSAVHIAALGEVNDDLLPAMDGLAKTLAAKAQRVRRHREDGPHAPDGRRAGDARSGVRGIRGADRARRRAGPLDSRARRTAAPGRHRDGHRPQHPSRVRREGPRADLRGHGHRDLGAARPLRGAGQPRLAGRALGRAQGRRGLADQDRERSRADGLGPPRRALRASAARAPEGLVDHARQGEPGDPRGRDPGRRPGDRKRRRDHRWPAPRASSS